MMFPPLFYFFFFFIFCLLKIRFALCEKHKQVGGKSRNLPVSSLLLKGAKVGDVRRQSASLRPIWPPLATLMKPATPLTSDLRERFIAAATSPFNRASNRLSSRESSECKISLPLFGHLGQFAADSLQSQASCVFFFKPTAFFFTLLNCRISCLEATCCVEETTSRALTFE